MNRYDPDQASDPVEWLALDDQLRIELVEKQHRRARTKPPNLTVHTDRT